MAHVWACVLLVCLINEMDGKDIEAQVTCLFSEDCMLPCSFLPLGGEVVHWFKQDVLVYSHPPNSSQLHQHFLGRTSVSTQQIAFGNASLVLQGCGPRDRGRYRCHVIKGKEGTNSYVVVKVEAPIRSVNLELTRLSGYEEVECTTQDVYPAPRVSWSTEPPTPTNQLKPTTRKKSDKHNLFSVVSKVRRMKDTNLTYSCTITSSYFTHSWTTSLTQTVLNDVTLTSKSYSSFTWNELLSSVGEELVVPCVSPWQMENFTLTWSFAKEKSVMDICSYDSWTQKVSNSWEGRAQLEPHTLQAGYGSLRLLAPLRPDNSGTYICTLLAQQRKHVVMTGVNVTSVAPKGETEKVSSATLWWMCAVFGAIFVAVVVGIFKLKAICSRSNKDEKVRDGEQVRVTITDNEVITEGSHLTTNQTDGHT